MPQIEKRKRAEHACCLCQARKIRCDRVHEDATCSACSSRGLHCMRTAKIRGRRKSDLPVTRISSASDNPWSPYAADTPSTASEDHVSPGFEFMSFDSGTPQTNCIQQSYNLQSPPNPDNFLQSKPTYVPKGRGSQTTLTGNQKLGNDEIAFLTRKGAFVMPPRPFQLALVRSYINFVHPRVPFVDIRELLHAISMEAQRQTISILLLQAIFFAGSVFINPAELYAAGYKSRTAACRELFARARCLFDLDYEKDRLTVIKSLILLSFWKERDTDKNPRHWMSIAVSLAYTAGLHRFPDPRAPIEVQRDHARTWWSLFCRDRILSLSMKRAGIIDDGAFETPLLTLNDFEFLSCSPAEVDALSTSETVQDLEIQKRLALIFIENTKLSLCVSRVLNALGFPRGLSADPFIVLPPTSRSPEGYGTLSNFYCIQELESWVANLPTTITELPLFNSLSSEANKVLRSHYCALRTLHLAASTLIYRSLEAQR